MTREEFVQQVSRLVEQPVDETTVLSGVPTWDSMSAIGFIAMADQTLGVAVRPQALFEAKTVADLVALVGDRLS